MLCYWLRSSAALTPPVAVLSNLSVFRFFSVSLNVAGPPLCRGNFWPTGFPVFINQFLLLLWHLALRLEESRREITFLVFSRPFWSSLRACPIALLLPLKEDVIPALHHKPTITRALREVPRVACVIPIGHKIVTA